MKKKPENCWEYWNCADEVRRKCPAYTTNSGRECWMVAGTFSSREKKCPKAKNEFDFCWQCPWFRLLNPDFK